MAGLNQYLVEITGFDRLRTIGGDFSIGMNHALNTTRPFKRLVSVSGTFSAGAPRSRRQGNYGNNEMDWNASMFPSLLCVGGWTRNNDPSLAEELLQRDGFRVATDEEPC